MRSRQIGVARVRGTCVGTISGAVSILAHGLGSGSMAGMAVPSVNSIVLLVAACAVVGTAVASVRAPRHEWLLLAATLSGGQVVGHVMLSMQPMHPHSAGIGLGMLAAHAGAVVASAALIRAAEYAYLIAVAVWERTRPPASLPRPVEARPLVAIPVVRATRARGLLRACAGGTRGPPLPA